MAFKYVVRLKYSGFPEFTINTTADLDDEAMKKAKEKIISEFPQLEGQDHLDSTILKSNDPY